MDKARPSPDPDVTGEELTAAFLAWHAANIGPNDPAPAQADSDSDTDDDGDYEDEELSTSEALEIILAAWGPLFSPADVSYTCSPHRIEATATTIREDYDSEDTAPAPPPRSPHTTARSDPLYPRRTTAPAQGCPDLVVQVGDAIWQRAKRRGLVQGAVRPVRVVATRGRRL
ncbi:MAG: hypothetical protein JWM19_6073 [Actinomycetia bacterium]|nr:hypothetical protein [Actinomycetes bacterium]